MEFDEWKTLVKNKDPRLKEDLEFNKIYKIYKKTKRLQVLFWVFLSSCFIATATIVKPDLGLGIESEWILGLILVTGLLFHCWEKSIIKIGSYWRGEIPYTNL